MHSLKFTSTKFHIPEKWAIIGVKSVTIRPCTSHEVWKIFPYYPPSRKALNISDYRPSGKLVLKNARTLLIMINQPLYKSLKNNYNIGNYNSLVFKYSNYLYHMISLPPPPHLLQCFARP